MVEMTWSSTLSDERVDFGFEFRPWHLLWVVGLGQNKRMHPSKRTRAGLSVVQLEVGAVQRRTRDP